MKRFVFLLAFSLLTLTGFGQSVTTMVNPSGTTGDPDTVNGAGTMYLKARAYGGSNIAIQLNIKKVSGTVAGYAILQGSVDHNSSPSQWAIISSDTLTLVNGDINKIWSIPAHYLHYRVAVVASGGVFTPKAYYYLKP